MVSFMKVGTMKLTHTLDYAVIRKHNIYHCTYIRTGNIGTSFSFWDRLYDIERDKTSKAPSSF